MLLDLHTHTYRSFDAFSSDFDILNRCIDLGIEAIAITEHDLPCQVDKSLFEAHGIELIPGCEYTDNNGAHIIGLYVSDPLPIGYTARKIINHIKSQDGLVIMPHPWKPDSGFMASTCSHELLPFFDFIELINGGWDSSEFHNDIVTLAKKYNLRMISSSDSHKSHHVGLCCTQIDNHNILDNARDILRSCKQSDIQLLINESVFRKGHKSLSVKIKKLYLYQKILQVIPYSVRRFIKRIFYKLSFSTMSNSPTSYKKYSIALKND